MKEIMMERDKTMINDLYDRWINLINLDFYIWVYSCSHISEMWIK
jgi:hypothetical protein